MYRVNRLLLGLLLVLVLSSCQMLRQGVSGIKEKLRGEDEPFVTIKGTQFYRNGQPYYFVGANFWYGAYLGANEDGRKRLEIELDQLKKIGVSNLRVLAVSEQTELTMAVNPGIQIEPGVLSENLMQGLDHLLNELAKRDMVAVLYLNNFWQWSGGMAQYMSWLTGEPPFDPDATGDWNGFMQNSAKFYRSEQAQQWYRSAVRSVIERTNTVNGQRYLDDPAIMAWQLANEPRPGSDAAGLPNFADYKLWIESSATFIKTLDPNHLVSTGSEGAMGSLRDIELYRDAHSGEAIDYLTFHLWPKNWSWLDIKDPDGTYVLALAKAKAYMLRHIEVAQSLGKPIVLEEFGVERNGGAFSRGASTEIRDRFYRELYSLIETQAALGTPIAGSNFWTWGGVGEAAHDDFIWRSGDPFTGDPPQEAQGLNSVYSLDLSTIEVIAAHARAMNSLRSY